jgi:hypothetical protein
LQNAAEDDDGGGGGLAEDALLLVLGGLEWAAQLGVGYGAEEDEDVEDDDDEEEEDAAVLGDEEQEGVVVAGPVPLAGPAVVGAQGEGGEALLGGVMPEQQQGELALGGGAMVEIVGQPEAEHMFVLGGAEGAEAEGEEEEEQVLELEPAMIEVGGQQQGGMNAPEVEAEVEIEIEEQQEEGGVGEQGGQVEMAPEAPLEEPVLVLGGQGLEHGPMIIVQQDVVVGVLDGVDGEEEEEEEEEEAAPVDEPVVVGGVGEGMPHEGVEGGAVALVGEPGQHQAPQGAVVVVGGGGQQNGQVVAQGASAAHARLMATYTASGPFLDMRGPFQLGMHDYTFLYLNVAGVDVDLAPTAQLLNRQYVSATSVEQLLDRSAFHRVCIGATGFLVNV